MMKSAISQCAPPIVNLRNTHNRILIAAHEYEIMGVLVLIVQNMLNVLGYVQRQAIFDPVITGLVFVDLFFKMCQSWSSERHIYYLIP